MTSARTVTSQEITPDAMRAYRAAKALHRDGGTPESVFELLASIVEERTWERLLDKDSEPFESFTAFVETGEPEGLGTTRAELVKLLALRHPHEHGDMWRKRAPWLRREVERLLTEDIPKAGELGSNQHGGYRATISSHPDTAEHTVARLKRDDPELAARVVAGEVSPNAAARAKGWRKPRIVVSTPASVAVRLRQHFTPQQVAELRALLGEDEP